MVVVPKATREDIMTIDRRDGETKKPQPSEGPVFNREQPKPHGYQEIPSQKKAPKGPRTGA